MSDGVCYPLSFAQQRFWFLDKICRNKKVLNIPIVYKIKGNINISLFEKSINVIINRHDSFRTLFGLKDDMPFQVIWPSVSYKLGFVDFSAHAGQEKNEVISSMVNEITETVFDLEKGPLFVFKVAKLTENEYVFLMNIHHIIFDYFSFGIFFSELASIYSSLIRNTEPELNPVIYKYVDYAIWQKQAIHTRNYKEQLEFWKSRLKDISVLDLPLDNKREQEQSFNGKRLYFTLNGPTTLKIKNYCKENNYTISNFLLSVYKLLLYRYSQNNDISVGIITANRNRRETERIIGLLVNTLILRSEFNDTVSASEFLKNTQANILQLLNNQDYPFDRLVEELHPGREKNMFPLIQVIFIFNNHLIDILEKFHDLSFEEITIDSQTSMFDLSLLLSEKESIINGFWEYNTSIFESTTIERLLTHFCTLIDSIIENSSTGIAELSITPDEEKKHILQLNSGFQPYTGNDLSLKGLVEEAMKINPAGIALRCQNDKLTYSELDLLSDKVANYLINQGVSPGSFIGIHMFESINLGICLLGVIKCGCAFVPLESGVPIEKIVYIVGDTRLSIILTQKENSKVLERVSADLVFIEDILNSYAGRSPEKLVQVKRDDAAYIIYTSGSTGTPKGVLIKNGTIVNILRYRKDFFKLDSNSRTVQLFNFMFDGFLTGFFSPLISGSEIWLLSDLEKKDVVHVVHKIHELKINCFVCTPSYFEALLDNSFPGSLDSLVFISLAGELIKEKLIRQAKRQIPHLVIFNEYGVTEASVLSSYYTINEDDKVIKIGRPLRSNKLFILSNNQQLQPLNIPGELCISGVCLAEGYLNKPELTHEKFIRNPLEPDEYLYKTGDKAKLLDDGNIQLLGRIDRQLKLNGRRTEPGEIEAAIEKVDGVKKSVLMQITGQSLVAFYEAGKAISETGLKETLKRNLPGYMIPSVFIRLDAFPCLDNGKINFLALQNKYLEYKDSGQHSVALPQSEIQAKVFEIWKEILNSRNFDIDSNFFDAGGHSLIISKMITKIEAATGKKLDIVDVFNNPTVRMISYLISEEKVKEVEEGNNDQIQKRLSLLRKNRLHKKQVN